MPGGKETRVFVTGGGGGIGFAIAQAFAEEGAIVGLLDVDAGLLDDAVASLPSGKAFAYACDVSDRAAVFAAIDDFAAKAGGLDVAVNNAVYFHYGLLTEMEEAIIGKMLDVGLKGVYWALQAATPHLIARGGGSVINLSSIAVSFSIPRASVYSSIKGAIDALTRQQAVELAPHGIRVNALAPGSVVTPGSSSVIDEEGWRKRADMVPLQRLATPEEIAKAALFLASDSASSITGVTLKIDAGMTVKGP